MTYSAESLRSSIKNHNHYGPCLNGSRYSYFCSKSNELDTYIDIDSKGYRLKEEIIKENNELKIKEKDSSLSREEVNREYDNIKNELEYEEKNEKNYYEKRLKNLEEQKKNEENNALNVIKELEKDIKNLKEIIEELRKKDVEEEDWNREKILNELKNEYELKLDRYKREKEIEKTEKEVKIIEMKEKIKSDKEVEFKELKSNSEFADKLIYCINLTILNLITFI
jgi:DNA repair exonuclease SbcCD ATPase subunit